MEKKIKIGIEINEVLRARWVQFDRYYVEEFGEDNDNIPEEPYVYDFFNTYKWEGKTEEIKYLNENLPDDIDPIYYQVDKETGKVPVDFLAFKTQKENLSPRDVYNKFMYEDYLFEIHGGAPIMYKQMDLHVEKFYLKYKDFVDFVILSQENWFSIPPTLFFLSKMMSRFKEYRFVEKKEEMWKDIDILITTDPEILDKGAPKGKSLIKLQRPYNKHCQNGVLTSTGKDILQINDLNGNEEFEKIIKYNPKSKEKENE